MARRNRKYFRGVNVDSDFDVSLVRNKQQYLHYYNRLIDLAISMFEWKNLPDTVDERYLEWILCHEGFAVFFEDDVLGHLALKGARQGRFDVYMRPTKVRAISTNGYNKTVDNQEGVFIYNNYLHQPIINDLELFAYKMYDIDMTVLINARAQKTPVLVKGDENSRLSMLNAYKEFDGNMPVIFANNNLNPNDITVLNTNAPFVADKLYQLKTQLWNEALTYLGISNMSVDKKERLLHDEVSAKQGLTMSSRHSRLEMRRKACKAINEMFGLNLEVNYREDLRTSEDDEVDNSDLEDENDVME